MATATTPRPLRQRLMQMRLPELQAHYREVVGEATRCPNRTWLVRRIEETLAERERSKAKAPEQAPSKPAKSTKVRAKKQKGAEPAEVPEPEVSAPQTDEVIQDAPPEPETNAPASDEAPQDATPASASPEPRPEGGEGASAAPESAPAEEAMASPTSNEAQPAPKPPRGRFSAMSVEQLQAKYLEVVGRQTGSSDRGYLIWKIREAEKGRIPVGPRQVRQGEGEPSDMKVLPLRLEGQAVEKMDEAWRSRGMRSRMEFLRRALAHYLTHIGANDAAALFSADAAQA